MAEAIFTGVLLLIGIGLISSVRKYLNKGR